MTNQANSHSSPERDPREVLEPSFGKPILIIFGLLMLWIILIALGTVVFGNNANSSEGVAAQGGANWQKPLFVLFPMLVLLGGWAWLLKRRGR